MNKDYASEHYILWTLVLGVSVACLYLSQDDSKIELEVKEAEENGEQDNNKNSKQQTNGSNSATKYSGLENLGNTCYMNSLIQALSGCPQYVEYCESIIKNNIIENVQANDDEATRGASEILFEFIKVLLQLKENDPDLNDCRKLHELIGEDNEFMRFNEQADAHELNVFLQDHLIEILAQTYTLEVTSNSYLEKNDNENQSLTESITDICQAPPQVDFFKQVLNLEADKKLEREKQSQNPILSMQEITIACGECSKKVGPSTNLHRFEFFLDINLDIPHTNDPVNLLDLMSHYFKPEHIEGYNCIKCSLRNHILKAKKDDNPQNKDPDLVKALEFYEKMYATEDIDQEEFDKEFQKFKQKTGVCTDKINLEKVIIQKKKLIMKPPKTLCIHFNRLTCDMYGNQMIRRNSIKFPKLLDLNMLSDGADEQGKNCCTFDIDLKYKLCSVIEHRGSPVFGHYIAAKRIDDEWWLRCNDKIVTTIKADQVTDELQHPYMLFYEKDNSAQSV